MLVPILIALVLFLLVLYLIRDDSPAALKTIPGPRKAPFIGHMWLYLVHKNFQEVFRSLSKKYGPIYKMDYGLTYTVVVSDTKYFRDVLRGTVRQFRIQHFNADQTLDTFWAMKTDPLFNLYGEEWHQRRKFLQPLFAQKHIRNIIPITAKSFFDYIQHKWDKHPIDLPIEPLPLLQQMNLQAVGRHSMGYEFGIEDPILTSLDTTITAQIEEIGMPTWMVRRPPTLKRHVERVREFLDDMVNKYRELPMEELAEKTDLLSLLVHSIRNPEDEDGHEPGGVRLTYEQVKDECLQFVIAGYDTTASTIAWVLFFLGTHKVEQDKVAKELASVFPLAFNHGCKIDEIIDSIHYDVLKKADLPYTSAVITESQRIQPVAPVIDRMLESDLQVGKYNIPKGTYVALCNYVSQHDPAIWGDTAEEWIPERWLDGEITATQRLAMLPFGGGLKMCIGMQLAEVNMKILLLAILSKYEVKTMDPTKVGYKDGLTVCPKNFKLSLSSRELMP